MSRARALLSTFLFGVLAVGGLGWARPATAAVKGDYYRILNVRKEATAEEIKRSYRTLARLFHPDRFIVNVREKTLPEGTTREQVEAVFKIVSEAYSVLSDEDQRKKYNDETAETFVHRNSNSTAGPGFVWWDFWWTVNPWLAPFEAGIMTTVVASAAGEAFWRAFRRAWTFGD